MVKKTRADLENDIKTLKDAGMDTTEEQAQLKALVLAEAGKSMPVPAKAVALISAKEDEGDFVPLNTESYETGGGGDWQAPATTGIKDAICEGHIIPDFVEDQLWFIFTNRPGAEEEFRGSLVCGGITRKEKSGAWKVKDVAVRLGVGDQVKIVPGEGIKGLKACEGKECQVSWDDISIKGVTQRRIQDVVPAGSEAAL